MDLNLYLGLHRSLCSFDIGSDLAVSSLTLSASSDSGESGAPEANSVEMEASASHTPYSPSYAQNGFADAPLASTRAHAVENRSPEYAAYFHLTCGWEAEGPSIPYSPSNVRVLQTVQEGVEPTERDAEYHGSLDEILGLHLIDDNTAQHNGSHTPYLPLYVSGSAAARDEENISSCHSFPLHSGSEFSFGGDGSYMHQDLVHSPAFRFQRLIESHQWRQRRLGPSPSYSRERMNFSRHSSPSPEHLMLEIMGSRRSLESSGKQKVPAEVVAGESMEKDTEEKNRGAANFDCNICFDMAKEPVVTSCGHLFCWPCLYQWLHVHSDHKECPICKGEVTEANVTPIYGRGSSGPDRGMKDAENRASGFSVPPRPRGNRLDSWRQHLCPISRIIGEGITNSWGHLLNHQMHNRTIFRGDEGAPILEMSSGEPPFMFTRSMTRGLHRELEITESGPSTTERRLPRDGLSRPRGSDTGYLNHNGMDIEHRLNAFPGNDGWAVITADIERTVGTFSGNSSNYGAFTSFNAPTTDHFVNIPNVGARSTADQASASSAVAVIHSETSVRDASAEPNSVRSSMPYRRRGGNSASGSSDDGGTLHARKRRRLH